MKRCSWATSDLAIDYHDNEWGVPVYDDRVLFEFLILEGAQAGLSWETVLQKRENYRKAFDDFDPKKVAAYDSKKHEQLRQNEGIIRNKLKIASATRNAIAFLEIQKQHGAFADFVWQFVNGEPIQNRWKQLAEVPATTSESDALSKALKKLGFNFVGSTICYAFMQAVGMVNDHTIDCFRHRDLQ